MSTNDYSKKPISKTEFLTVEYDEVRSEFSIASFPVTAMREDTQYWDIFLAMYVARGAPVDLRGLLKLKYPGRKDGNFTHDAIGKLKKKLVRGLGHAPREVQQYVRHSLITNRAAGKYQLNARFPPAD